MPLVGVIVTWLCGWLAFRLLARRAARLDALGVATAWLLGAGVIHFVHYVPAVVAQLHPPVFVPVALALLGLVDLGRTLLNTRPDLLTPFRRERRWGIALLILIGLYVLITALNGYNIDVALFWLGKAQAYAANADYLVHLHNFPVHPGYPPLFTHQYQWQLQFASETDTLGMKLPSLLFVFATLALAYELLRRRVAKPLKWTAILLLIPVWWIYPTMGMADAALSAFVVGAVAWLDTLGQGQPVRDLRLWVGALLLGLAALVKNEGPLLAGCVVAVLAAQALIGDRAQRRGWARMAIVCGGVTVLFAATWWVLVAVVRPDEGDFALSAFRLANVVEMVIGLASVVFDPRRFYGVWLVIAAALILKRGRPASDRLVWGPMALYALVMFAAYLFSASDLGVRMHIVYSYDRLLLQVLPLGVVYLAGALEGDQRLAISR